MKPIDEARSLYLTYMSELNNHILSIVCSKIAIDKVLQECKDEERYLFWEIVYEIINQFDEQE